MSTQDVLGVLDEVQRRRPARVPRLRTVPPSPGSDPPDMFRGQTFTRAQIEKHARDLGVDYETAVAGVVERGGRVLAEDGAPRPRGVLTPGNVDLYAQPVVKNRDGTTSTVDSFSVNFDGSEYLLPTVTPDGRHLSDDDAVAEFRKTGRHLGIFDTPANATAYATQLHNDYAAGKYARRPDASKAPAMGWAVVNGERVPVEDEGPSILGVLDAVQQKSQQQPDNRSPFARAYDVLFTPPEAVTRGAAAAADVIDAPSLERGPLRARLEGFGAGALEGAASLLTPGDVALTALGYGPLAQLVRSVRGGARAASAVQRGANVATGVRGVERLADAESLPEAAAGVAQVALGSAGAMVPGRSTAASPSAPVSRPALPPGARFVVGPDGRVVPAGTDIPMTVAPDGSYVRSVPGEYARREVRGALPAARTPIVTPPPPGSVPAPVADPSYVRGVPAEVARREVRALLPGGRARFVGQEHGPAVPVEQANEVLAALDVVQGRTPAAASVHSQRAAVLERDVDPTRPTAQAVSVRQFSGDPSAVDAPLVGVQERRMLEVMRQDLQEFPGQRGRLVRVEGDENASVFARGGAGSSVGDDVRTIAGNRPDNASIARAIDDLLEGKPITNKTQIAALDAARGYLEKRPGYRGPQLPMEAADEGGLSGVAQRLQLESADSPGASAASGGGAAFALDDFDAFSRMFDDITPSPYREPGESGFIASQFAAHVGGGVAGAAAGAASGEDTGDRIKRGALFGVAGAVAPSLLRRTGAVAAVPRPKAVVLPMPERGTVPRVGRSGQPIRDPLADMDAFLGKFSNPLVRTGIEERLIANTGYAAQRRGVIGSEDLGRFAGAVKVDVTRVLPKGSAASGEVITAYARAAAATQRKVSELTLLVKSGKATDADLLRLEVARADADVVLKSLMGLRAEAGRALAAFRFLDGVLDTGNVELIRGAADQLRADAQKFAREFSRQPNDPLTRYRWLQQQGKATWWDKARSYYYSSILSGVKTHERNILGNIFNAIGNTIAHPFAAGIDTARAAATGKPREVLFSELPHGVVGAAAGVERGFADVLFTLRHGISPQALNKSLKTAEVGKLDLPRVEFRGGAANPFNWPGRALDAADVFFRSVARNTELYESAYTQAVREGKHGPALVDRMAELRAGLTPEGAALRENAEHVAARAVFQEKGGPITSWLAQGYRIPVVGQAMTFVMPFLRTPANILRQGLEASPVGFHMQAARHEGRPGRFAQGRAAVGSVAAGYLAWLAATGRLSGNGPTDPAERAALMESGWRPNSIRFGDQWVSYQLMQPISVQAALIGNAYEAWVEQGAKGEDAPTVAAQTLARSVNSFLDQSFLSGLFDIAEALKDPERSAGRWAGRQAHSLTPFSGLQRTIRDAKDAVQRAPRGAGEQLRAGVPGISETVPPRIDRFGEAVTREGGPTRRALDPFNASTVKHDPVADELARLGVKLTLPSRSVTGQTLTRQQEVDVQQRRGRAVRAALERLVAAPGYQRMSDTLKTEVLEKAIETARRRESQRIVRELRRRAHDAAQPAALR